MSKHRTSKHSRRTHSKVLEVRVMSPRIAWLRFLSILSGVFKLACVLAVVTGIGWGIWQGVQHAFFKNPDFSLQVIDLNPNPIIDEAGLVKAAGIDLTANLFDIDSDKLAEKLAKLPGLTVWLCG